MIPAAVRWGIGLGLLGGGVATAVHAETSRTFQVTAAIQPGCAVVGLGTSGNAGTIGTLNFGTDSSLSTATHSASLLSTQTIVLRCTPGVSLLMAIDGGQHAASGMRNLQSAANAAARLGYSLCADAGCTTPIGIGQQIGITVTSANMNDIRLPVFGRLILPGNRPPGTYSDVLTMTLTF